MIVALALTAAAAIAATEPTVPSHDIAVRIDPATRRIEGHDVITRGARRAAVLMLSARFAVDALSIDGRRIDPRISTSDGMQRITLPASQRIDPQRIEIRWSGTLAPLDRDADHRATLSANDPAAGVEGTFLPAGSGWYPAMVGEIRGELASYRVAIDLPAGQVGLVPGRLLEERTDEGRYRARFEFEQPAVGITLVAGPYRVEERNVRTAAGTQLKLRTYFHGEIADVAGMAAGYLDSVAGYIDLYENRIGAYPFSGFSVVSSPTPTGFGMPTMTYLGIDVLRLPFIRATSLGHEVLHNWWGNGVYPDIADFARGNWSEGLTTFMADYAYKEGEGEQAALDARLAWLRDFAAMPRANDRPLQAFSSRSHGASQIVGYHKAAMLFYMLRDEIGATVFERGLQRFWREQRFKRASWTDLRGAFEKESGQDLAAFFNQWLARAGAPDLRLGSVKSTPRNGRWSVAVSLSQGSPAYSLSVPLLIRSAAGETRLRVRLSGAAETVIVETAAEPQAVYLDPVAQLFRRLAPSEAPPSLRQAMLSRHPALILPGNDAAVKRAATELVARLFERAPRLATSGSNATALLVAGLHADVDAWLAREKLPPRPAVLSSGKGSAQVWTVAGADAATSNAARAILMVSARDAKSLGELQRPLRHYGQQSFIVFDGATMIERGVWPLRPQEWRR